VNLSTPHSDRFIAVYNRKVVANVGKVEAIVIASFKERGVDFVRPHRVLEAAAARREIN
jgi:hypothetical protein